MIHKPYLWFFSFFRFNVPSPFIIPYVLWCKLSASPVTVHGCLCPFYTYKAVKRSGPSSSGLYIYGHSSVSSPGEFLKGKKQRLATLFPEPNLHATPSRKAGFPSLRSAWLCDHLHGFSPTWSWIVDIPCLLTLTLPSAWMECGVWSACPAAGYRTPGIIWAAHPFQWTWPTVPLLPDPRSLNEHLLEQRSPTSKHCPWD